MNNDLEQEYSKYGIDLTEIERIIAEYTGSSTYDDLRKKSEEDAATLPTPSEVKEKEAEEEPTLVKTDGKSVLEQRLSEAKTDSVLGLDEEVEEPVENEFEAEYEEAAEV